MIWGRITIVQKITHCHNTVYMRIVRTTQILYLFANFQCKYYIKTHDLKHKKQITSILEDPKGEGNDEQKANSIFENSSYIYRYRKKKTKHAGKRYETRKRV